MENKKEVWHKSDEIKSSFSKFNSTINRLILLDVLWNKVLGRKADYWVLDSVKGGSIYVKVTVMAARHELKLKEKEIIKELNKNFNTPWIKQIFII